MKCWRYLGAKRLAKTPSANQGTNRNQVMFISTDVLAVNLQKARPYQKFGSFFLAKIDPLQLMVDTLINHNQPLIIPCE